MTDEKMDQILRQTLSPEIPDERLNRNLKTKMAAKAAGREGTMKRFNMKKAVILAAACCLLVGTVGVASSGKIVMLVDGFYHKGFESFGQLKEAQADAGFNIKAVERFHNGYAFSDMYVNNTKGLDEDGNTLEQYKEINIDYKKAGEDKLNFHAFPAAFAHEEGKRAADLTTTINGIEVKYYVDTYKWVPENYELTAQDEENMKRDDYYISVGVDQVSENKVASVAWFQDGVRYSILNVHGATSSDVLFGMAEEIITSE